MCVNTYAHAREHEYMWGSAFAFGYRCVSERSCACIALCVVYVCACLGWRA